MTQYIESMQKDILLNNKTTVRLLNTTMDKTLINPIGYMERTVPFNLFPLHERYLTREWAKQTYRYFYLFDGTILTTTYKNDNDLDRWITRDMMREIKIMGTQAGRDEVVQLAADGCSYLSEWKTPTSERPIIRVFIFLPDISRYNRKISGNYSDCSRIVIRYTRIYFFFK